MRKFIVKNRPKRKYTRKSAQTSSFSFSRTLNAGLIPFFVMAIALVTTLVINSPLQEPMPDIRFTFELPEISLTNAINTVKTLPTVLTQAGVTFVSYLTMITEAIKSFSITIVTLLDPRPAFVLFQNGVIAFGEFCMRTFILTIFGLERTAALFVQSMTILGNIIFTDILTIMTAVIQFISTTVDLVTYIAIKVTEAVIFAIQIITAVVIHVTQVVVTTFINIVNAIVDLIMTPFRIVGAFLWQFKPYTDILGAHIKMAGDDFSNGFTSLGKLISSISSPK